MLEGEASALSDKIGELHRTVDNLLGLLHRIRFGKPLNSQREHVDKRELPLRLIPAHIHPPRSNTLLNVLSRLVNSKVLNSEVMFQRRGSYLLHKGRLAAPHRARYSDGRGSGKPAP